MNWFRNLPIGKKLAFAFGITTLMTIAMGVLALVQLHDSNREMQDISSRQMPAVQSLGSLRASLAEFRTFELSQLDPDTPAEEVLKYNQRIDDSAAEMKKTETEYAALTAGYGDQARALYTKAEEAREGYMAAHERIRQALEDNDLQAARAISSSDSRNGRRAYFDAVKALIDYNTERLESSVAQSAANYRAARLLLVVSLVLLAGLSVFLGWAITRSLNLPLRRATTAARDIAAGKLDGARLDGARDEVGDLLRSMQDMRDTLQRFASESHRMATLHATGENIGYPMPEDFPGTYNELVAGTNKMVFEHLDAVMEAIDILNQYAVGDLSRDARRLPGQRAVLHESMDAAKNSLVAMRDGVLRLSEAAGRGDFSPREDEQRFQYSFRDMMAALNKLMQEAGDSLGDVARVMSAIAKGDLRQRVEKQYEGAFGALAADANSTAEQLTAIVSGIQQASTSINAAAGEIAAGNSDLSRRTEQQAANLEETAASMEELTSTVRQNAESARQANQLAQGAAGVASKGGEVVGQVVTTMSAIETSSKKIAEIISVIDGIAFQTNILALNAAVEAARAGEQGRGFAVVASEVRTLAQRSANAAKEIKGLIDDSVGKVADGSALVHQAGTTMGEIVTSVQRVTDIMAEISAASQEQSAGIEQVNQTVTQMDETTQQNAALVEEATAAARSMEEQAGQLAEAVSIFDIGNRPAAVKATLQAA